MRSSFFQTNARVGFLDVDGTRLYFFPDRLLVFRYRAVSAVRYTDLTLVAGDVQFIETGGVPSYAKVIGTTWRFVNKSGSPDRRFSNNYQLPTVLYGTLDVAAPSGMKLSLQTSAEGLAAASAELLLVVQAAVRDLEARRAGEQGLESLPDFADDPPPLLVPGSRTIHALRNVVSLRWLDRLPEWASLALWGILFALPLVAGIVRFAEGGMFANFFLLASLIAASAATARLIYRSLRRAQERRIEEEAATNRGSARCRQRTQDRPWSNWISRGS